MCAITTETCDRCGVNIAARVKLTLPNGSALYFCHHHYNEVVIPIELRYEEHAWDYAAESLGVDA